MILLDGKEVAKKIEQEIIEKTKILKDRGITPGLAVILVGADPASQSYVKNKEKLALKLGFYSTHLNFESSITQEELIAEIKKLNNDPLIHGILIQLPLPKHIEGKAILDAISRYKDVDGFNPYNVGKLDTGDSIFKPCTPYGIMKIFEHYNIELSGKHVVVLGRSNIVGKPIGHLVIENDATVTVCHSKTKDIKKYSLMADILISAIGRPNSVTEDMVSPGTIVVDVGINRVDDKLVGDVDFENVKDKCSYITPVPGGVGSMTVIMLMYNTLESALRHGGLL
jgi:methylenetetrahydrofolate dehydrogenase (NADP+)/methenyltetrahydrofolate cyclohydrolase